MTPAAYARLAAMAPTNNVTNPDRNHDVVDHRLFADPIAKNTAPVTMTENTKHSLIETGREAVESARKQRMN